MSDGMLFLLIFLALFALPAFTQLLLCLLVKSRVIKAAPAVLLALIWIICLLGSYNLIYLPQTSLLATGGFIAFYDYMLVAIAGVPMLLGMGFGWLIFAITRRAGRKRMR